MYSETMWKMLAQKFCVFYFLAVIMCFVDTGAEMCEVKGLNMAMV